MLVEGAAVPVPPLVVGVVVSITVARARESLVFTLLSPLAFPARHYSQPVDRRHFFNPPVARPSSYMAALIVCCLMLCVLGNIYLYAVRHNTLSSLYSFPLLYIVL